MSIGIQDQCFGCEIEMTGISRSQAAEALARLFGTRAMHYGSTYDGYEVRDPDGKAWKLVSDSSIQTYRHEGRRLERGGSQYAVEMVSPKLTYQEMEKLQQAVRTLRQAGAVVNSSCGLHVHVDAANHTPQSLRNVLSIMYAKEDILFAALKVNETRVRHYCQKVDERTLKAVRKLNGTATMAQMADAWYTGSTSSRSAHYNETRYHACNLHSVFYRGTLEWRCFESTLHAGEVRADITLALAISAQAINQKRTQAKKTPITENPAFTFRTFLLRLGLIGPEYKNVRQHLLKNLPGDRAWRYDRSQYPSLQNRQRSDAPER